MKTRLRIQGQTASFVVSEADPLFHEALRGLAFQQDAEEFARSFPAETPDLESIYKYFTDSLASIPRQKVQLEPVNWEHILGAFLERAAAHMSDWYLVGSAALAVRGLDVQPGDVDLVTSERDAETLDELFRNERIEPLQRTDGWIWSRFGRAFPGGRLEWVGGVNARADTPRPCDFGLTAAARLETVAWRGAAIRVPPLDLQLAVSERRGLQQRADQIRQCLQDAHQNGTALQEGASSVVG